LLFSRLFSTVVVGNLLGLTGQNAPEGRGFANRLLTTNLAPGTVSNVARVGGAAANAAPPRKAAQRPPSIEFTRASAPARSFTVSRRNLNQASRVRPPNTCETTGGVEEFDNGDGDVLLVPEARRRTAPRTPVTG
jgi:hypothetical protein